MGSSSDHAALAADARAPSSSLHPRRAPAPASMGSSSDHAALAADARAPSSSPRPRTCFHGFLLRSRRPRRRREGPFLLPAPPHLLPWVPPPITPPSPPTRGPLPPPRAPAIEAGAGEQCGVLRVNDATGETRPPLHSAALVHSGEHFGVRGENEVTRGTRSPSKPAALVDAREQCGVRRESGATGDTLAPPNPASEIDAAQKMRRQGHGPASGLVRFPGGQIVQSIPMGSSYWDTRRYLLPDVEGIHPLRFSGRHPAWEGHAVPLETNKNTKVGAFYCMYCEKSFSRNAAHAGEHLTGSSSRCKIPPDVAISLMDKIDEHLARWSEKRSNAKGRKAKAGNFGLKKLRKCTVANIVKMVMDLCRNGDDIGDGLSGVLVMARALLRQAEILLPDGIEFIKIAQGFETAAKMAFDHLQAISQKIEFSSADREPLVHSCMAALSTTNRKKALASIAVDAVLGIADMKSMIINLDYIKVHGKFGGRVEHTELVHGIVLEKEMRHPRMPKKVDAAKIALLACSFEHSKTHLNEMVKMCQMVGATLIISQYDFEDEAGEFLMRSNMPAVQGVTGVELESIAIATGGQIVSKFQDLSPDKLGKAESVTEKELGRSKFKMFYIEKCANSRPVTILLHGGNKKMIEEIRSLADALCVVIEAVADRSSGTEQKIIRSFARVLDAIPLSLAENSGLPPIETLARLKSWHVKENNPHFGIDCNSFGNDNMQVQQVFASLDSKMHQISLALKVLKLILKDLT
ncbi:hypothetical protein ACQ4PT_036160 [Festuca glaucescens]